MCLLQATKRLKASLPVPVSLRAGAGAGRGRGQRSGVRPTLAVSEKLVSSFSRPFPSSRRVLPIGLDGINFILIQWIFRQKNKKKPISRWVVSRGPGPAGQAI